MADLHSLYEKARVHSDWISLFSVSMTIEVWIYLHALIHVA